jgi:hypothetical protein
MAGPGSFSPGDILTAADLNGIGVWDSYTPVLTQAGTRTATVNYAEYVVINKLCFANIDLTCTTSGSAANIITVSLPVAANSSTTFRVYGSGSFFDDSANDVVLLTAVYNSTTTVRFLTEATTDRASGLGANPSVALANNDVVSLNLVYETA